MSETGTKTKAFTAEQDAVLIAGYPADRPLASMKDAINALPGAVITCDNQMRNRVESLRLRRSPRWRSVSQAAAVRARLASGKKQKQRVAANQPIAIPLRELIRFAGELGVARSKCMDVGAVNYAKRREEPGHPGYVVVNGVPAPAERWRALKGGPR